MKAGLKDQVGELVVEHLNDTIVKDLLVPVLLLLLKLLDDRLHVVGAVLSEGHRLRSIRRHFEDTDIHPRTQVHCHDEHRRRQQLPGACEFVTGGAVDSL